MNKYLLFIFVATMITVKGNAQKPFELGAEYMQPIGKGYNNGRAAIRGESFNNKSSFSAGITYQLSSKNHIPFHTALAFTLAIAMLFSNNLNGNSPFVGARVLFSLENFEGQTSNNSLFITPWAELGYHMVFAKHIFAAPSIGYGYTKKMSKDYNSLNEDDGGRIIPALSAGYRF